MEDLENEFARLKERVIAEQGHKKRNFSYSNEVRFLVVDLVKKVGSQSMCAKMLSLSQSNVCKWVLQNQKIQIPRRLTVTNNSSERALGPEKFTPLSVKKLLGLKPDLKSKLDTILARRY
jgi:hypothetical protein